MIKKIKIVKFKGETHVFIDDVLRNDDFIMIIEPLNLVHAMLVDVTEHRQ